MAESWRNGLNERDVEQAITALKKGAQLLKYGRRGKPKFCPFRLSADESCLIWYSGRKEKQLKLSTVSKIIPGQRTAIFQRYPRPDKEYQSFSLIYNDRSLDVICKDKDDAEVWFVGLKALISPVNARKWRIDSTRISSDTRSDRFSCDTISTVTSTQRNVPPLNTESFRKDPATAQLLQNSYESHPANSIGKVVSDVILYTTSRKNSFRTDSVSNVPTLALDSENTSNVVSRGSAVDSFRVSLSSAVSSSSHGSGYEEFDALGDVFIWGEGAGEGIFGGGIHKSGISTFINVDAALPKALESTVVLDVHNISCGSRHAAIVTRQGEVFTWGEESGGRLGHGVDTDLSHPKLVDALNGINIEFLACGEFHTCAVSFSGDLYTWGDGYYKSGLLGNDSETSHWIPRKVNGQIDGLHISYVSCGPWHTSIVTSAGQMFTFGDGTFGVLGHGDSKSICMPREVDALRGMRVVRAACGVWHSAAIVEMTETTLDSSNLGKLFTWGNGDKGRLGHGDTESRLLPAFVASLCEHSFCQVACGNDVTIALTASGQVFTMGSTAYGQLGNPTADGKLPTPLDERFCDVYVEEISCGSYHAAILTSKTEVYTWGKGANGRLGHGDIHDRDVPTLVEALKDKQVKSVACGSNFTAVICLHKWVSSADQSICSGCRLPFGFRRKRHNCYNCGLVFCKLCSSKKSVKASLAPSMNKPYRVCDECYTKIKKAIGSGVVPRKSKQNYESQSQINSETVEKDGTFTKPAQLSRLSSILSFKGENKQSRQQVRFEIDNSRQGESNQSLSSTLLHGSSKNVFFPSVPNSRTGSRSSSPIKTRSSPHMKSTSVQDLTLPTVTDSSSKMNSNLSQEVVGLQLQVEELTHKAQNLEAELETTKKQLKESTMVAEEESLKYRSAKEVIKSLTEQLKDMGGKVPDNAALHTSSPLKSQSNESLATVTSSPSHKSNGDNGTQKEVDWVEQIEPGVYLTLSHIHGGGKLLKRVRFSRRRFSEQKANQWWVENRSKLEERYTILSQ